MWGIGRAQQVAQFSEGRLAALQALRHGRQAEGALPDGLEHLRGPLQDAALAAGPRWRQALVGALPELEAASVEVQVRQSEGVAGLPPAIAFQGPVQQGRQVRPACGAARGEALPEHAAQQVAQAATHLPAGQAAPQGSVVGVHQPASDGGEEVEMAHQVECGRGPAGGDGLGHGAAQVAHEGQRRAEVVERRLQGGLQFGGVLGADAGGVQHPAAPAVEAQEQPAAPLVAGGVEMQGVAVLHGGPQGRGAPPVQASEQLQEAVAERGHGAVGELQGAAGEALADLAALAQVVVALQSDPNDEVVAVTLSGRRQGGQLRGGAGRGGAARAAEQECARPEGAGGECGEDAGAALAAAQGGTAVGAVPVPGREVELRKLARALQGAGDAVGRPAGGSGVPAECGQQCAGPPFSTASGRSNRSCTARMWERSMGGEWPCRWRASWTGLAPGWRMTASSTSMTSERSSSTLRGMRWRRCSRWRPATGPSAAK